MRVRRAISIDAPVERAFAYLEDPENSLALIPSLVEVTEIVRGVSRRRPQERGWRPSSSTGSRCRGRRRPSRR
jgi:hypothetical protein